MTVLLKSDNEIPRAALDFLTKSVIKTIDKIAEIADVSIWPTYGSTDNNNDEVKTSDNDSNASDGGDTAG